MIQFRSPEEGTTNVTLLVYLPRTPDMKSQSKGPNEKGLWGYEPSHRLASVARTLLKRGPCWCSQPATMIPTRECQPVRIIVVKHYPERRVSVGPMALFEQHDQLTI